MRTTLDVDTRLLNEVRKAGGFSSRKETVSEALRLMKRRLALSELAADIGKHPKAFKPRYDPEAGET